MKRNITFAVEDELLKKFDKVIKERSTVTSKIVKSAIIEEAIRNFIKEI